MRDRDAGVVYLVLQGATALLQTTTWTTAAIYLIDVVHLGPLQLVLLGTVMEASIFVFEIPTGLVADTAGRRRSIIIGTFVMGAALMKPVVKLYPYAVLSWKALFTSTNALEKGHARRALGDLLPNQQGQTQGWPARNPGS